VVRVFEILTDAQLADLQNSMGQQQKK